MKKLLSFVMALFLIFSLVACKSEKAEQESNSENSVGVNIRIGGLKGPTSMGMVKLLDDSENGLTVNTYDFHMAGSADELTPKLINGELDVLAVPANLGSVLYNKTNGKVKMLAVNMLGAIYIAEKGEKTVNSLKDLKGKTIFATGKGTTPEYVLTYLLKQNGIDAQTDVNIEWKSEPTETVAALSVADNGIAMLPQPYLSVAQTKIDGLRVAVDLYDEWEKLDNGCKFVTAGIVVRSDFADENQYALKQFLKEYNASTKFVKENIEDSAKLIEKYDIVNESIAKKALPMCNIVCMKNKEMKNALSGYLEVLFEQNPASVGGKLPKEDFYLMYE